MTQHPTPTIVDWSERVEDLRRFAADLRPDLIGTFGQASTLANITRLVAEIENIEQTDSDEAWESDA